MSRQLVKTQLPGWDGPRNVSITEFHVGLDRESYNGPELEAGAFFKIDGYVGKEHAPRTEDSYRWFWVFYFVVPGGKIAVLIPWAQDWLKGDDSQSDRSPAIYTQETVTDEQISELLAKLSAMINQHFNDLETLHQYYRDNPELAPDPGF